MSLDGSNVEGWKDAPSLGSGAGGRLGMVVSGSLTEGVQVKLDPDSSVEAVKVGTFVTLQGERMRFFGVVTDVSLGSTDATLSVSPPDVSDPYVARVISGTAAYGALTVEPMLTIAGDDPEVLLEGPQPAKTVPPHFAEAAAANEQDIERVFGGEGDGHFWIGSPLDMDTKLCLDVPELVMRSNGVFGKSGTGKTFLTRLLLAGILQSGAAVNLVFDMESEYGWRGYSEAGSEVKGLKQLFHSQVAVFSLDEASSKRRGLTPDYVVRIGYDEVEPDDIVLLRETLDLSEVAADAAHSLRGYYGKSWLSEFLGVSGRDGIIRPGRRDRRERQRLVEPEEQDAEARAAGVHGGEGAGVGRAHPALPGPGDARGAGVRQVRAEPGGVHTGGEPADEAHLREVRRAEGAGVGRQEQGADAAGHHD